MVLSATKATTTATTATAQALVDEDPHHQLEDNENNPLLQQQQKQQDDDDDETTATTTAAASKRSIKKKKSKQSIEKQQLLAEWRRITDDFCAQSLHPCYINHPVRKSTIEAAAEYPQGVVAVAQQSNQCAADDKEDVVEEESTAGLEQQQQATLMMGTHKHLGGAFDPTDGCIYGVPANSRAVLCLHPDNNDKNNNNEYRYQIKAIPLPAADNNPVTDMRFKWLRGMFAHGYLWAIPAWASAVLCVDVDAYWKRRKRPAPAQSSSSSSNSSTGGNDGGGGGAEENLDGNIIQYLPLPEGHPEGMTWQWHGAGLNRQKNAIYCIPSNAHQVLKVDLTTKTTSFIPITVDAKLYPSFEMNLSNKWYGGILGNHNCVYGVPYRSCAVLKIDCDANTACLVGPDYGCSGYNWHGGIQVRGKIYAHPSHAPDTVLVIDTNDKDNTVCSELPIQRAAYDTDARQNYKWLGGALGADGNIYCPACDTSAILKINPQTDKCTTFGFTGTSKNKWQGGVLSPTDGCIYCIPASGRHILRIATFPGIAGEDDRNPTQLLGNLSKHKDKWQGGHVGLDGCLYFIPENGYRVLKVTPPKDIPVLVNGELPKGDVKIELI